VVGPPRFVLGIMAHDAFSYRSDPAVPPFPDDRPILVFDGNCVLCSRFAQFILRTDRKRCFRLLAAQTPLGTALYSHFGLDPSTTSRIFSSRTDAPWLKSEGSIRIFEHLGFPWSLMSVGRLLPRVVRDWLYGIVARNRAALVRRARHLLPAPIRPEADRFIG